MTSSVLAASVNTHPVVIRRLLATLSRAGIVVTGKGSQAGSRLQRLPSEITLGEVFRITMPASSATLYPHGPNKRCLIGHNIEGVLITILGSARAAFEEALGNYTLADVLARVAEGADEIPKPISSKATASA
ncbi:MAG: Rrf2 family transcriptional regulator [Chthoniobacteraceae bacterium]|nr:Rrf2 family transcriptional regulator [Chthoniobacteraceae bacterium]